MQQGVLEKFPYLVSSCLNLQLMATKPFYSCVALKVHETAHAKSPASALMNLPLATRVRIATWHSPSLSFALQSPSSHPPHERFSCRRSAAFAHRRCTQLQMLLPAPHQKFSLTIAFHNFFTLISRLTHLLMMKASIEAAAVA